MKLRDYQERAITMVRKSFSEGNRKIMIYLATGGGKSVIFGKLSSNLYKNKKRTIFIVKRRQLIFQAQKHLTSWGIDCGTVIAGKKIIKGKDFYVCSIDTVRARIKSGSIDFLKDFDAVIVDECHDCTSQSYISFFDFVGNDKIYIGLTATPFEVGKKIHSFWDSCEKPIEVHELRDMGYLTDARVFMSKSVDTSSLKVQGNGDFKNSEAYDIMKDKFVVGNVIKEYKEKGQNKPAILFAVNVEHSKLMAEAFIEEGINAIHCDANTPQKERDNAIKMLSNGEIKVLCNVNIFSTGVDIPQAEIGIMARPTASEILYIQQLGRLLRPCKICLKCKTQRGAEANCHICGSSEKSYEKKYAVILDHGENTNRLGLPFEVRSAVLKESDKKKSDKLPDDVKLIRVRECLKCFASNPIGSKICLHCGSTLGSSIQNEIKTKDGILVEVTEDGLYNMQKKQAIEEKKKIEAIRFQRDFKPMWVNFQLAKKYKRNPKPIQDLIPAWIYKKLVLGELDLK